MRVEVKTELICLWKTETDTKVEKLDNVYLHIYHPGWVIINFWSMSSKPPIPILHLKKHFLLRCFQT